jgi:hypothetical protein
MKKLHFFLFVAALASLLTGCNKSVEVSFDMQTQTIAAEGGTYTVELKSNGDWNIAASADWLTVSPTSGNGDATLTLVAQRNASHQVRSTEIKATTKDNTATLTVSQEFVPNTHPEEHYLTITPTEVDMDYMGGRTTIDLECDEEWMTDAGVDWARIDRTEGNGNEQVTLTLTQNTSFTARQVEIKFVSASQCVAVLRVRQEGAPDPHYLNVSPAGVSIPKEGGTGEFTVETDEDWRVRYDGNWLTLSTDGGSGNGTIVVTVEPNEIYVARQSRVTVVSRNLEKTVFVTQEPGDDPYMASIEPDSLYIDSPNGGVRELTVTSNCDWTIEAPSWITLETSSGSHNATFDIMVGYNDLFVTRTGVISVIREGEVLARTVVVQAGRENILNADVTDITVPAEGGAQYFNITSNQTWEIQHEATWIQCTPSEGGAGTTTVMVKAVEWHGTEPREALIVIKGDFGAITTVWVYQNP